MKNAVRLVGILVVVGIVVVTRLDFSTRLGTTLHTSAGRVAMDVPAGWSENDSDHPFDLQVTSRMRRMNMGIFEYKLSDLEAGYSAEELLSFHVNDLSDKRTGFEAYSPETRTKLPGKMITTRVFSGENEGDVNLYSFSLVQFDDDADFVVIAIQIALPEDWEKSRPVLEAIVSSIRLTSGSSGTSETNPTEF